MADALALGASGVTLGGSSPLPRTNTNSMTICHAILYYEDLKDGLSEGEGVGVEGEHNKARPVTKSSPSHIV